MSEDKVTLTKKRAELIVQLQSTPHDQLRIQGELRIINAKIKALNTTQASKVSCESSTPRSRR